MPSKWKRVCGIRGDAQRTTKKKQGPLSPQSLADNISKLSREQMERLFNQMVQCVVGWGLLDGERSVALDGSKLPTPATYEGCGKLKQTHRVKVKGQQERAIEEYYVYGWRVLVLIDVHTRLPLAMKVVKIEAYEGRWLVPLLEQAQRNLGTRGHISTYSRPLMSYSWNSKGWVSRTVWASPAIQAVSEH